MELRGEEKEFRVYSKGSMKRKSIEGSFNKSAYQFSRRRQFRVNIILATEEMLKSL
jgi:hypothetical protein